MGSLGERLRQARLDRGVSLSDAEQETHIRRKYLEALESEDFAALPAPVYTRGFIRTYARYLGLDPEATLDLFGPSRTREERTAIRAATPQLTSSKPVSVRVFMTVAGLVLALLLLAYLWTQYTSFVESLGPGDQPGAAGKPAPSPTIVLGAPTASPGAPPAPALPTAPGAGPAAGPPASPTPERGIVLEARVTERTWMEVWVDGTSQLQATLQAGTVRTFNANRSIRIRVGNAAGVQATVNGQATGPLGERFQVKEVVWER